MLQYDCEVCANRDTYKCDMCVHNVDLPLEDNFELCEERLSEYNKQRIARVQESVISEWINVSISNDFACMFDTAKKCAASEHHLACFMGVFCTDKELVASDTHEILVMACDNIPAELQYKVVIKLDGQKAGITTATYPEYKHLFSLPNYESVDLEQLEIGPPMKTYFHAWQVIRYGDFSTRIAQRYLHLMQSVLTGKISCSYPRDCAASKPVLFAGENGRMLIMPLVGE